VLSNAVSATVIFTLIEMEIGVEIEIFFRQKWKVKMEINLKLI
jgi:hypothetical protein